MGKDVIQGGTDKCPYYRHLAVELNHSVIYKGRHRLRHIDSTHETSYIVAKAASFPTKPPSSDNPLSHRYA